MIINKNIRNNFQTINNNYVDCLVISMNFFVIIWARCLEVSAVSLYCKNLYVDLRAQSVNAHITSFQLLALLVGNHRHM